MKTLPITAVRTLRTPAYTIAVLLMLIPIVDTTLALMPVHPSQVSWRFGAVGIASQALMTPLLGLFVIMLTAVSTGSRAALRFVQIVAWVALVFLILMVVVFVLDAIQMRSAVRPEMKGRFDTASMVALGKYFIGSVVAVIYAIASRRALRDLHTTAHETPPLVVGTSGIAPPVST